MWENTLILPAGHLVEVGWSGKEKPWYKALNFGNPEYTDSCKEKISLSSLNAQMSFFLVRFYQENKGCDPIVFVHN